MDDSVQEFLRTTPAKPGKSAAATRDNKAAESGMSRGAATAWICGTIFFIAIVTLTIFIQQDDPNDPYAECYGFFGDRDPECAVKVASKIIRSWR